MIKIAADRIKVSVIQQPRRNTKRKIQVPTVTFEVANGVQLPYKDGEFDAYFANFVLHLVPSAADLAREARRVLKQGTFGTNFRS